MSDLKRVECFECSKTIWVDSGKLPSGIQPKDLFENFCPGCDKAVYVEFSPLPDQEFQN